MLVQGAIPLVAWACAVYLAYRAVLVVMRVRWARRAYPRVEVSGADTEWKDRCRGALLGLAIGDALNLPAERLPPWVTHLRYPGGPKMRHGVVRFVRRAGDVSDDTQLAIAVARSIFPDGRYDHERFVDELRCWFHFRVAAGRACSRAAIGARTTAGGSAVASEGVGAAMRAAPLAIAMSSAPEEDLLCEVEQNARATHESQLARSAAAFVALIVRDALQLPRGAFAESERVASSAERASRLAGFSIPAEAIEPASSEAELVGRLRRLGTTGWVQHCVPAALSIAHHHGLHLRAAMRSVFRAGGDTDSIGALVATIIGAQLGAERLPTEWVRAVQHRDYLCWLADRLAQPLESTLGVGEIARVRGDVAQRPVEVVVNAWNRNVIPPWLLVPQGVSRAIRRAGGGAALRDVGRRAPLPLGLATETRAGRMACEWIVHVAGIDLLWRGSEASVRSSIRSALRLSAWLGARSVAVPLIGAGSGGLDSAVAEQVILEELGRARHRFDRLELVLAA